MGLTKREKAELLIECISHALRAGVIHYNQAGIILPDVESVLLCLRDEGKVSFITVSPSAPGAPGAHDFSPV